MPSASVDVHTFGLYVIHVVQLQLRSDALSLSSYFCESAIGLAWIVTRSNLISFSGLFLALTGTRSIISSVESCPSITRPKMVYLPSRDGCLAYEMKNWSQQLYNDDGATPNSPATCSSLARRWPWRQSRAH